ncbi:hypothetical protein A5624_10630 [Mycobacterium sp. 1482292.6]|uniref:hypothetical protein n=1 Tax=unclassified Mycobacterium TaxID=2642494 RepID=UPI000802197E|nr:MULTISPECIES: hypothetical protein [unclassified Mycobacterium]OBJ12694.1 hypothetical protein A5624_10630 [Mycobacterium sp. 1482292.6]OBJ24811.1 hypothetical protein A5622_11190 [Mycobacterium sp. 1245801.1]
MSDILYNFQQNDASLTDVRGGLSGIHDAREEIGNLFAVLLTVYEGQGADALDQAQRNINSMLDDVLQDMTVTQQQAQDQQQLMQALDAQHAAQF